jgi:hypothetical protein
MALKISTTPLAPSAPADWRSRVESTVARAGAALAAADLSPEERDAFLRWDARRLNELGGSLHLLVSIPDLAAH